MNKITVTAMGRTYNIDPSSIEMVSDFYYEGPYPLANPYKTAIRTKSGLDIHIEQTREETLQQIEEELSKLRNPYTELLDLLKASLRPTE